jgi:hypothetical protein
MKSVILLLSCFVTMLVAQCNDSHPAAETETSVADTAHAYVRDSVVTIDTLDLRFYIPVNGYAAIETTRPLKADSNVLFVCAAAFTRLDNGKVDGLFIENGKIIIREVNHTLGGGIILHPSDSNRAGSIFGTDMGKRLDAAFIDSLVRMRASFFQQIQMVRDGQALVFRKDMSRFQRRAICFVHGRPVVVETLFPCTLQKFADVLKAGGIQNALYVDMGSWDEGWYRDHFLALHTIGLMRNQTAKQSNWFVFRRLNSSKVY